MTAGPQLSRRTQLLVVVLAAAILGPYCAFFFGLKPAVQLISLLLLASQAALHRLAPTHAAVGCLRALLIGALLFSSMFAVAYQCFIFGVPPTIEGHPVMALGQMFGGLAVAGLVTIVVVVFYLRRWRRHPNAPVVLQLLADLAGCITLIGVVLDASF